MTTASNKSPALVRWIVSFALAGFCAGFFGPMLLNPDANQGPMLGIFITGPGGALAGLMLGALCRLVPLSPAMQRRALVALCSVFVVTTLYFCLPQPERRGEIIEARAVRCLSPQELFSTGIARWEHAIAAAPWAKAPSDWKARAQQAFRDESGVVLEMAIERRAQVYEHRRPWNRGEISIAAWQPVAASKNYFARAAGSDCAAYLQQPSMRYYPQTDHAADTSWPPLSVPNFLDLLVLTPVPASYPQHD